MAQGIIREDYIVDIVDIDVNMAKTGTTTDTPHHIEQPVISIRVRLEGYSINGDLRPWVDLRTTPKCWNMIAKALKLAALASKPAIEGEHKTIRKRLLGGP